MKEEEIRPEALFNNYLALAEKDIQTYFLSSPLHYIPCPACGEIQCIFQFRKMGFDYEECSRCGTLFVNPRPDESAFVRYYTDSPSVRFWADHFYKDTEEARREKLIRPKAERVGRLLEKYLCSPENPTIIDIGAGYGVFCEELKKILADKYSVIGIEPAASLQQICKQKNIPLIPKFLEDVVPQDFDDYNIVAATSFELLEHLYDPHRFIETVSHLLHSDSLLILTTLSWAGFDLQMLREESKSIHPPHHINFFTPLSLSHMLENAGFSICEITTPGELDVDIVAKQLGDINDPFIKKIVSGDETIKKQFQTFLQKTNMSSHMMVVARKR